MKNSELINYAKESAKVDANKGKKVIPKIRKCMYTNCPINATTEVNGQYRCNFHESGHFHAEVTAAIVSNVNFINAYNKMVRWDVSDWYEHEKWLRNSAKLPMEALEPPSQYLIRFFAWVSGNIKSEATAAIERKPQ